MAEGRAAKAAKAKAMDAKKPMKVTKITLEIEHSCGYAGPIRWGHPDMLIIPGYSNESGTAWPMEIHVTCPRCHETEEVPELR